MEKLTTKQESFLRELIRGHGVHQTDRTDQVWYSRQQLLETAREMGMKYPPAWIVQDASRKTGDRGNFYVDEVRDYNASSAPRTDFVRAMQTPDTKEYVMDQPDGSTISCDRQGKPLDLDSYALSMVSSSMVPDKMPDYVSWGHHKDIESIVKSGIFANVYVTGLSGNGKTTMIEQICAKLKREMFRVNITAQTDEDDLLGGFRLVDGETKFVYGPVIEAMKRGSVLLLDEVDLGLAPIMCLQPVLEGKGVFLKKTGEWIRPAAGFVVIATANTKGEGSDDGMFTYTNIQNEAFLDRFAFTYDQGYATKKIEKKILQKKAEKYNAEEDDDFLENLVAWAEVTRKAFSEGAVEKVISTRRLEDAVKAFAMFGDRMKAVNLVTARFDESTREAFSNLYTKVDADVEIEEDGTGADAPWEPSSSDDMLKLKKIRLNVPYDDKIKAREDLPRMLWEPEGKYWYLLPEDVIGRYDHINREKHPDAIEWETVAKWEPTPIWKEEVAR